MIMLLKLQILFTILSAICIAVIVPIGAFLSWSYAVVCILLALLFFGLMLLCKQAVNKNSPEDEPENDETQENS